MELMLNSVGALLAYFLRPSIGCLCLVCGESTLGSFQGLPRLETLALLAVGTSVRGGEYNLLCTSVGDLGRVVTLTTRSYSLSFPLIGLAMCFILEYVGHG